MPAEFEPHKATWLAWPQSFEAPAKSVHVEIVAALQAGEEVHILVNGEDELGEAKKLIREHSSLDNVFFHRVLHDDMWIRDYGPTFVEEDGEQVCVDWMFDGWGKRAPYRLNDQVPRRIAELLGMRCLSFREFVVEGGAIDVNGLGTCLTSDSLTNPAIRDPIPSRREVEEVFAQYLGVGKVIWLEGYLPSDTYTYGHVDGLARFVDPHTIVLAHQPDPEAPGYNVLENNYRILREARDQDGKPFKIIRVPVTTNRKAPVAYTNFYIGNKVVLLPVFGDPRDEEAVKTLSNLFPTRKIIPINCSWLTTQGGEIHCITQQQPSGPGGI